MAASNYYGFAHGGAQYSTQPTAGVAYSHPSTPANYTVQQAPPVAHTVTAAYAPVPTAPAVRPATSIGYGSYQTPHSAADYGYGQRQPEAAPQPAPATTQSYQPYYDQGGNSEKTEWGWMTDLIYGSSKDSYNYARPTSTPTSSYDKQYYQQPVSAAPQPQPQHTATESYYQTAPKNSFSQSATQYTQAPQPRQVTAIKPAPTPSPVTTSYTVYPVVTTVQPTIAPATVAVSYTQTPTYNTTPVNYSGSNYSGYEAAVYSAATSYYQQQPKPPATTWTSAGTGTNSNTGNTGFVKKPAFQSKQQKPKPPPKQPQLHYCDVCKISCAGPQTYREHLEGQKHKKKEAALKAGNQTSSGPRGAQGQLRCELCDVSCTGADAYAAHIRGAKHQKVVKLHTKLGKPIPSTEPVVVNSTPVSLSKPVSNSATTNTGTTPAASQLPPKPAAAFTNNTNKTPPVPVKKPVTPKITFVGGNKLPSIGNKVEEMKVPNTKPEPQMQEFKPEQNVAPAPAPAIPAQLQNDVQPVGHDYVEEVRNDEGKVIRFHCKLCECSFNDPNAKDMHLKGRRHRLQYKKKVNPDLQVEIKPSIRARKIHEEKMRKQMQKEEYWRRREEEERWRMEMRRYEEDIYWRRVEEEHIYWEEQRRRLAPDWHPPPLLGRLGMPQAPAPMPPRRPDSSDDRYIMTKHANIYPTEEELQAVQRIVSQTERALKLVSDMIAEPESQKKEPEKEKGKGDSGTRVLKGVMRVGVLAKGLLLRGDRSVNLILLSAQKPTKVLLERITTNLPKQLSTVTEEMYEVKSCPQDSSIVLSTNKEPKMQVTISVTSPVMRDDAVKDKESPAKITVSQFKAAEDETPVPVQDPPDMLNKQKCLDALAALRHAKWFQARANGLQSCVIIIRILRDLCQRVPTWGALPDWAMELLVEKAISSSTGPLSPGDAMRRVLECVASGVLLPDGPGLLDPCEKDQSDALSCMTDQQREDITASAQHALRLLAFRQIHKVLGMDPLPQAKPRFNVRNRKRRRDTSEIAEGEGEGKKDKKDSDAGDG